MEANLTPKQNELLNSTAPVTLYGGSRGGGKSFGLRICALARCIETPNFHAAIFRRTYPELEANHIRPLLNDFPELNQYFNRTHKILELPNGSTLAFRYCKTLSDVDSYRGVEYHGLYIDEAGDFTEAIFRRLMGSNRSSNPEIKAHCVLSANPGGCGHAWIKRIFVTGDLNERERPEDYKFIRAKIADNPYLLEADPDYVRRLEAEPSPTLRRAFIHGDWDIFAGQFFSDIRRDVHMIPTDTEIPEHWHRFISFDYGFNHPAALLFFATDEDGITYLYREHIQSKTSIEEWGEIFARYEDCVNIRYAVTGADSFNKGTGGGPTIAEKFARLPGRAKIIFRKANIDRVQGAVQLRHYLKVNEQNKPRLLITENCQITFDCLSRMQHDPNRVEDVLKVDSVEGDPWSGDDAYDALRYGLMSRPIVSRSIKDPWRDAYDNQKSRITWKTV